VLAGVETCVGLAILGLGIRIGLFPLIPEDMHPSPGAAAFVVIFAGLGFAFLNGLRLLRLFHLRKVEAGAAFSPAN
jgi:hypothetical protein